MRFTKSKTATIATCSTPADQLVEIRAQRRAAKGAYDTAFHELQRFYLTHPPARRPFLAGDKFFQPTNTLKTVPPEQRRLEGKVARSRERWAALLGQEASLLFALGLKH